MEVNTSITIKKYGVRALIASVAALMFALVAMPLTALGVVAPNQVMIPVEQIFTIAPGVERDARFSYELRAVGGVGLQGQSVGQPVAEHPMPGGTRTNPYIFTLSGSESRDIGPLTFARAGQYVYEIRNSDTPSENLSLDDRIYSIHIEVRNVPGGGLEASIVQIWERNPGVDLDRKIASPGDVVFEKGYEGTLEVPVLATIPVVKTVQGNPANPYTFTFRLEAAGDYAMPEGATGRTFDFTITGSGRAYIPTWSHSTTDTFTYTVREIPSNNSDYVFDTTVYTITDTVTRTGNTFQVDRVITTEDNRAVTTLSFINTYVGSDVEVQTPPPGGGGTTTGPIPGPKTGDYADPLTMIITMIVSTIIALFAVGLIYLDRRSEKDERDVATIAAAGAQTG